jgi:hypothetical protein
VLAVFPIASGDIRGEVHTVAERQPLDGLADPRIRLSVGLRGAPARTAADLATVTQEPVVGAAVVVMPPLGRYDERADRQPGVWPFKPEVGATCALGSWTLDGAAGVWLFTPNDAYFPGHLRKTERPLYSLQGCCPAPTDAAAA